MHCLEYACRGLTAMQNVNEIRHAANITTSLELVKMLRQESVCTHMCMCVCACV